MAEGDPIPSASYVQLVDRRAERISDPVEKLRYVRQAREAYRPRRRLWAYYLYTRPPGGWRQQAAWAVVAVLTVATAIQAARVARPHATHASTPRPAPPRLVAAAPEPVWMVERTGNSETYSNGLRIEDTHRTGTRPRVWRAYTRKDLTPSEWRHDPAGIVFHTTESNIAPFEPAANASLRRNVAGVLHWVAQTQCYHFVIDRFGRVFRVVEESDYANHAGPSIWADDKEVYIGLNQSFLGVAFEAAQSAAPSGERDSPAKPGWYRANTAQVHAARVLTDWLRSRYRIKAVNCVTHAQVSVNGQNMSIGYHTDWASDFPFTELGLGDGYARCLASIEVFGFTYDASFLHAIGRQVWQGMLAADEKVLRGAAAAGVTPADYRAGLQRNYKDLSASLKAGRPADPGQTPESHYAGLSGIKTAGATP